jgi:hypothetical protein
MTFNRGTFFDKQGNHMLNGSVARETLKWWANTFEKGTDIADPESLKVQFTSGAKAFGASRISTAGRTIITASTSAMINSRRSPARSRRWARRATARRSASPCHFLSSANRDKEWA